MRKTYRRAFRKVGNEALRGMDLTVPEGSAFGLIGPNGAGKTTFIKSILGIVQPTEGTVRVLGGSPEDPRIRARIGYLPERLHLPGSWTPTAFLATVTRLKGLKPDAAADLRLLERVGLADAVGRKIGGYSKGMRQRLGLAAAMVGSPSLLILDEPTDGIDPMGRLEVRRILLEEVRKGTTLFLNSHLLAETERVCDRVAILADGRVVREGRLEDLARGEARWMVRFAPGVDAGALTAAGFKRGSADGVFHVEAQDPMALNAALDKARAGGALLVELRRDGADLESVLLGTVAPAGAVGVAA
ncbi:ABC transporter ATP-binding protein [Pyxidicoccus fallax]|uniref:ABC transporter ATP-binding protein n=1 Tax=Pyxidicoccus fallax TaxID=394095 RepID=A0A848LW07_9BACT|nr:ABC transporter ATP-binding protein [Pyxidicoccus fallax]NMO21742.1 ABC transporter ATP-binding protein [Pyxidicoccus fallax]NPC84818.1 ABC transporter ATP-binding protein [Pyxidicoccus fallax]